MPGAKATLSLCLSVSLAVSLFVSLSPSPVCPPLSLSLFVISLCSSISTSYINTEQWDVTWSTDHDLCKDPLSTFNWYTFKHYRYLIQKHLLFVIFFFYWHIHTKTNVVLHNDVSLFTGNCLYLTWILPELYLILFALFAPFIVGFLLNEPEMKHTKTNVALYIAF